MTIENGNLRIETILLNIADENHITNCYLVYDNVTKEALIIDPGDEGNKIIKEIEKLEINPKYIVLTHCHGDHIGAVDAVKYKYENAKIVINKDDYDGYFNPNINCINELNLKQPREIPEIKVDGGDTLSIGDIVFNIIHTPGHTKGGMCLYNQAYKVLFSGDTLFANMYGRTDLESGSDKEMEESLNKLFDLPDDTIIYSGHGKAERMSFAKPRVRLFLAIKG